jgi:hypothetical protein
MRFEVLMAVEVLMLVFQVEMPCGLVKMEAVCFCEMLVSTYKFTKHYHPEDQHQQGNTRISIQALQV